MLGLLAPGGGANAGQWRAAGSPSAGVQQAQAQAAPQFDPFEADMPAAEPERSAAAAGAARPGGVAPRVEFDPFEANDAQVAEAAPVEEPREDSSEEISIVQGRGPAADDELNAEDGELSADDGDRFDASEAYGAPRRGVAVGPAVEEELEAAQDAVEDEIIRREEEGPQAPEGDTPNPFRPGDAMDAPRREDRDDVADALEEAGNAGADEEFDADEFYEGLQQQAPGGYNQQPFAGPLELTPEQQAERARQLELERQESAETCRDVLAAVKEDNIRTVSLDIKLPGEAGEDYPFDCGLGEDPYQPRAWVQTTYLWKAAGLCHKPLYFEQVQTERYGHSAGPVLDPLVAGAHFFGTVPVLPYKMGLMTPNECVYTLGYYRPGSCAPYSIPGVPFTWRAAAFEAGAWTAGAVIIP